MVVHMLLPVDSLGGLGVLLRPSVFLNNLWGSLGADLGRVGLVRAFEEVLYSLSDGRHGVVSVCMYVLRGILTGEFKYAYFVICVDEKTKGVKVV